MEALSQDYKQHLDQLSLAVQNSDLLATYLDEESDIAYKAMIEAFEPHIGELYNLVAERHPLQLIALETALLDAQLEGLFLPKILGYSVLRGEIDALYKYKKPQDHFRSILLAICESANFEFLKLRIGQTVQIGFALSSDIWLTNLLDHVSNKKVKAFLVNQKLDKYRDADHRKIGYSNYKKQFESVNFNTTEFPETIEGLRVNGNALLKFLKFRAKQKFDNSSLLPAINRLISNDLLKNENEFLELLLVCGMFYDIDQKTQESISKYIDEYRKKEENFEVRYFGVLLELYRSDIEITPQSDKKMSKIINKSPDDGLTAYYNLMEKVHNKGYVHDETIIGVKEFYDQHKGVSLENECLRESIFGYCASFLNNLDTQSYHDYFEINKVFISYINTFYNQKFNQNIKELSLEYINKLLDVFTDKRGKDYQDIKKFVTHTFLDLGFKSEKELVEMFKTKK